MIEPENSLFFDAFCVSWLATWAAVKFKASAYKEYESVIRLHLVPAFGGLRLTEITPDVIQSYIASRLKDGLAPRTVNNHVIVLKSALGTAMDYKLLSQNPVDSVARPRTDRTEMRFLTPSQLRELIEATEPSWRLLIAVAGLCGLRKGEILALEWTDLDLNEMTVSVTKSMRAGVVGTPKTKGSIGQVPLPETLSSYIAQRRRQAGGQKLVFCRRDGSPLGDSVPNRILQRALVAAHLPAIRFHDLRHTWAVGHLRAGTDIKTLAALGRWSSPMTLLDVYSHVIPSLGRDAVTRFDEFLHESLNA